MEQPVFATTVDDHQPLSNPQRLVKHHLLVVGQTGSGKTTSVLSLLSCLQQDNLTTIILDPTGEYAKLPNTVTYRLGDNAYLEAGQFDADTLCEALDLHFDHLLRARLAAAINDLRLQQNLHGLTAPYRKLGRRIGSYQSELAQLGSWANSYQAQLLGQQVIEELIVPAKGDAADYSLLGQEYDQASIQREWYSILDLREKLASQEFQVLFDPNPRAGSSKTELNFVIKMFLDHRTTHRSLVVDLSALKRFGAGQRVVISALLKQLLATRLQSKNRFPVNLVLDEAHRYLPKNDQDLPDNGIFQVLREGRKVGLSMVLTTQSPLDLPAGLRSQFANLLVHQLTSPEELTSLAVAHQVSLSEVGQLPVGQVIMALAGQDPTRLQVHLPKWWHQPAK